MNDEQSPLAGLFWFAVLIGGSVWFYRRWQRSKQEGKKRWEPRFRTQIGNWPKIWLQDQTPPLVYDLRASYPSPDTLKRALGWSRFAGFVGGFTMMDKLATDVDQGWLKQNWLAVIIGGICGWVIFRVVYPLLRFLLWRLSNQLTMVFRGGVIEWQSEAQLRSWWPFGKRQEKIFENEEWGIRVIPHRKAAEEMRKVQEAVRRGKKEPRVFYQQCSEVLIDAGQFRAAWLPVAEISDDEHLEKATKLQAGILLAARSAREGTRGPVVEKPDDF